VSTDEGHSPETSGQSLRFWHFNKLSSPLFIVVTSPTQLFQLFQLFTYIHFPLTEYKICCLLYLVLVVNSCVLMEMGESDWLILTDRFFDELLGQQEKHGERPVVQG